MIHDYFPELDGNQSINNGKMGRQLFKGGGGGSSTTTNQLDPTVRPFVKYGLQEAQNLYQSDTPSYYPYQTYVSPSEQTQSALQAAQNRAMAGNPLIPAAQQQLQNTIQGNYLSSGNPYLQDAMRGMASAAGQNYFDTLSNVASQSSKAGRYGSGAMNNLQDRASQTFANTLVNKAGELGYQNYADERARQEAAILNAPQMAQADYADIQQLLNVGQTAEDYQQKALEADINRFEFEQNLPYTKLQSYLSAAYGAPMGQVSTTKSSGGK